MKLLKTLFCKFYLFQIKVGNEDIAPFSTILILGGVTLLYLFDLLFFMSVLFNPLNFELKPEILIFVLSIIMGFYYYIFLYKAKYKSFVKEFKKKKEFEDSKIAIAFVGLAFLLYISFIVLKILQNSKKI